MTQEKKTKKKEVESPKKKKTQSKKVVKEDKKIPTATEVFSEKRVVFITEVLNEETGSKYINQLAYLLYLNPNEPVTIYINSPGGLVDVGMSIISLMYLFNATVRTVCIGKACSMAAMILAAGTPGYRYVKETTSGIMIHQISGGIWGKMDDVTATFKHMDWLNNKLASMLSKYTKQPLDKIKSDFKEDYWMDPEEAKAYGIVDHILGAYHLMPFKELEYKVNND